MKAPVTVVAFNLHNWTNEKELELNKELSNVRFHYLESTSARFLPWLFSSLLERTARLVSPFFPRNLFLAAMCISKRSWVLLQWAKQWEGKPVLIIAHNPPAFYAAGWLGKKINAPFALDVEDYHPGEGHDKKIQDSVSQLMRALFKKAAYISYASPLIKSYTEKLLPQDHPSSFVINNVFQEADFSNTVPRDDDKMKIAWFSQNIDYDRGLEEVIPALSAFEDQVQLTLIGNPKEPFCQNFIAGRKFITLVGPLSQKELHRAMDNFDIGLAIEPGKDINNGLALSNKIWTYYQAGLFIIASDTPAQSDFLADHPGHGVSIALQRQNMPTTVKTLIDQLEDIRSKKTVRFEHAKSNSWEIESGALLNKWQEILD